MPMKPVKRSVVADSKTGYVHKFDVYTGKKEGVLLPDEENRTSHLQGKKNHLYIDNLYTSEEEKYGCSMPFSGNSIHEVKGGDGVGMMSLVPRLT